MSDPKRKRSQWDDDDLWEGLGGVDVETQADFAGGTAEAVEPPASDDELWAGLGAADEDRAPSVINQLPPIAIEGDPHAGEEPWYSTLLRDGIRLDVGAINRLPGQIADTLTDSARGFAQGLTMRTADELGGAIEPGASTEDVRARYEGSRERSPRAYDAAEMVGAAAPALLTGGLSAAPTLGGRVAAGVGTGALQGAITGAASGGEDDTSEDAAWRALVGGGAGAFTGGVTPLAGAAFGAVSNAAAELGKRAQNWAVGASGPEYRNVAQSHGLEFADDLGEYARRELPHGMPWTARDYAQAAGPLAERTGRAVGDAVDAADAEVPLAARAADLYGSMRGAQGAHASRINSVDQSMGRTQGGLIDAAEQRYAPGPEGYLGVRQLHGLKTDLETPAYPDPSYRHLPEGVSAIAHRELSAYPRSAMHDAVLGTGGPNAGGGATPQTQAAWQAAFGDHAKAATLRDIAQRRALTQESQGQDLLSVRGIAGALGGRYAPDLAAKGMRGASQLSGAVADRFENAASSPINFGGQAAGRAMGHAPGGQDNPQDRRDRIAAEGRGDMLEPAALELVRTTPQAFGPYLEQFQNAADSEDPAAITSLLGRLESDERWRTQFKPNILAATSPRNMNGGL